MEIALWPLAKLQPYPQNPRQNDDGVQAVANSLREFGFRQPIVVDTDGVIVCGHTRWKAAQRLGLEKVPVHVAQDLTPEQLRAYRIADNQTANLSSWDLELLPAELGSVPKPLNKLVSQVLSDEGEFDHAGEVFRRLLEAREDAATFLEPADQTLHDVAATIRFLVELHRAGIAIFVLFRRDHRLDSQSQQVFVDPRGAVPLVAA